MHQVHCNGHDKLGPFALQMDSVGIPLYGMTDQSLSAMLELGTVPNNRHADVIGHVYLDFVEHYGCEYFVYISSDSPEIVRGCRYSHHMCFR